jgi:hypothetical protein
MLEKLAYSLGRNDEEPNIELAKELAKTKNKKDIKEIVNGLNNPKEQIANDCIKVLYEIAGIAPELVSEYAGIFVQLLTSKNNRLVWGSMTLLAKTNKKYEKKVFPIIIEHLGKCRLKEVAQHAERAFICINKNNSKKYKEILLGRYKTLTVTQKKRVDKLLKDLE